MLAEKVHKYLSSRSAKFSGLAGIRAKRDKDVCAPKNELVQYAYAIFDGGMWSCPSGISIL